MRSPFASGVLVRPAPDLRQLVWLLCSGVRIASSAKQINIPDDLISAGDAELLSNGLAFIARLIMA
jgi:hypothetical protein